MQKPFVSFLADHFIIAPKVNSANDVQACSSCVSTATESRRYSTWRGFLLMLGVAILPPLIGGCGAMVVRSGSGGTSGVATFAAEPSTVDFGSAEVGNSANSVVSLVNGTTHPVVVSQLSTSSTAFVVDHAVTTPLTVDAGTSSEVKVQFKPNVEGDASGTLTISSNYLSGTQTSVKLHGKGYQNAVSAITCGTASFSGAGTDNCVVSLASVTKSAFTVNLSSSSSAVSVPSTVTVPSNANSVSFTATIAAVNASQSVTITASGGGVSKTVSLQLNAATAPVLSLSTLTLSFGSISLNTRSTMSVTLTSSGTSAVTVNGASVTGSDFSLSGGSFPITLSPGQSAAVTVQFDPTVSGAATGQLTVSSNSSTGGTSVVSLSGSGVSTTSSLSGMICASGSMTGSGTDACTVTLSTASPTGGLSVSVASSDTAVSVPVAVTVPAGSTSASFSATVSAVSTAQTATISAAAGGVSKAFALQLNAAIPTLSVSTASLSFGSVSLNTATKQSVTLTSSGTSALTISGATVTGSGFSLVGGSFSISLNPGQTAIVTVQFDPTVAGALTGQLAIASNSSTGGSSLVSLSGAGVTSTPALSGLTCASGSITGSATDSCAVTLTGAAPTGGVSVALSSSSTSVSVPASVTVGAGATTTSFAANISAVSTSQPATITATAGGVTKAVTLQLSVTSNPVLTINASSVSFGSVTVNTTSVQPITLSSTGSTAVTISAATATGAGFTISGLTLPLTLNPGQSATLDVQFDPTTAGSFTGQLTITSNSSSNGTAVISLSGTATSPSYQVGLAWSAPTGSTDPVVGYNVYRELSGGASYQKLTASANGQTTYTDTNVQGGSTYNYYVTSIDGSGVESVPSNIATVSIP